MKPEGAPCEHPPPPKKDLPDDESIELASSLFRGLGDPHRLRLMCRLAHGEACVSELSAELEEGMSTISQRLRMLRAERLVRRRRDGKHVYYALADEHVGALVRDALAHVCENDP